MKYYRAWIGYDRYLELDEDEVQKALAAQLTGGLAVLSDTSVSGKSISLIEPDIRRALGFKSDAQITSDDKYHFKKKFPEYIGSIMLEKENVERKLNGKPPLEMVNSKANSIAHLTEGINKL